MLTHSLRIVAGSLTLLALAASALAQGDDNCGTAQVIAGLGVFPFDNSNATTDGLPDNLCLFFGQSQIDNDVWWSWTAAAGGPLQIDTCSQTSVDTKIAVYDTSCAGAVIACGDDACSLQTTVQFNATSGHVYIIRLGTYPGSAGGTGTFTLSAVQPPAILASSTNPANGHMYHLLEFSSWTVAEGAAVALGGHLATVNSQAEHDWILSQFHNFQGFDIDLWIGFNDASLEGTFLWSSGEPVVYTNWDVGEPNNGGTGEDYGCMRYNNPLAFWNDLPDAGTSAHSQVHGVVELGATVTIYCTAKTNSLGCVPMIGATGTPSATASSGFAITGSNVRNNKNGLLFYGVNGQSALPFQNGTLCVKTPIRRTGSVSSAGNPAPANDCSGVFSIDMNTFAQSVGPPVPLAALKVPGTVVNTQWWGRDQGFPPPNNTTLTDGLEYTVGP